MKLNGRRKTKTGERSRKECKGNCDTCTVGRVTDAVLSWEGKREKMDEAFIVGTGRGPLGGISEKLWNRLSKSEEGRAVLNSMRGRIDGFKPDSCLWFRDQKDRYLP